MWAVKRPTGYRAAPVGARAAAAAAAAVVHRGAGRATFYQLLNGGLPKSVVMMPLLVRSKLVHIVYVDQGSNQMTRPNIGELLILAQGVGRAYDAMIRRRQSTHV